MDRRGQDADGRAGGTRSSVVGAVVLALVLATASPAAAEFFLDGYTGKAFTLNSDLHIKQSGGTDFTFSDVSWLDKSFEGSPYHAVRGGYFFESIPWFGLAIDFFHFKVFAETTDTRPLSGTVAGVPVGGSAQVGSLVQKFEVSHGVNYFMLDALFRYGLLKDAERFPKGIVQLYGGVGLGAVLGHAESVVRNVSAEPGYEWTGIGVQAIAGVRVLFWKYLGVFAEYKFTHTGLDVGVAAGRARLEENTHHVVGGISIYLPSF
jgi:opacity protein-like surface antigen